MSDKIKNDKPTFEEEGIVSIHATVTAEDKMSQNTISMDIHVTIRKKRGHWVASCPMLDVRSQGTSREEAKSNLKEAIGISLETTSKRSKPMLRLKCEEELAKIVVKIGHEQGFELDTIQIPFLVTAIASWIDEHFGLVEDPILRRIKASQI